MTVPLFATKDFHHGLLADTFILRFAPAVGQAMAVRSDTRRLRLAPE